MRKTGRSRWRRPVAAAFVVAGALALPSLALGHIERASYWPDPAPDKSVTPAAGGEVPKVRGLFTALNRKPRGKTRVVCAPGGASLRRLRHSIHGALANGYRYRPKGQKLHVTKRRAGRLYRFNQRLRSRCKYHSIQDAVTASHNNDRVVVMPGLYTEPKSRARPTNDPACANLKETNDRGNTGAVSYAYQAKCPNDQNLIAVIGRKVSGGSVPQPPLQDRHGIPVAGRCIRCNLQLEGSGLRSLDVIVDAGDTSSGNHGPANPVKDVGVRADRADGFVLTNMTVRHAAEHGIYVMETDGYLLQRFRAFYNEEYGVLTFVSDHAEMRDCEAKGSGDSGLYPGAAAETGRQGVEGGFEPKVRYNHRITRCDSHHNTAGYSGTDANAVKIDHDNFYGNANGFTTDVFTAAGHPGFPQDSDLVVHNNFFSNNFNPYLDGSDVTPTVPMPVGTGMWIAGGNNNNVHDNRFWNNWRRGTMLFAVPDSFACGPTSDQPDLEGCTVGDFSTSYDNRFHDNVMGVAPGGAKMPNGKDFWWDHFLGNTGNCWYDNTGPDGTEASVTEDSPTAVLLPLPSDCSSSIGMTAPAQETELINCLLGEEGADLDACPWFTTPPKPRG